jgi:hypothetical protein
MDAQDIHLGAGGFDCEKEQNIIFFANAFSSMPQIAPIQSALKNLFQRFQPIFSRANKFGFKANIITKK